MNLRQMAIQKFMPSFMVGIFARPYIGGYSMAEALDLVVDLEKENHLLTTIDLLGEEVQDRNKALSNKDLYLRLIRETAELELGPERPTVSLKPSSLTVVKQTQPELDMDRDLLVENFREIFDLAREKDLDITIDMEDRFWTDVTIEIYTEFLKEGYNHVGTVLQTRLHRTEKDIENLPDNARIRLCIGIYQEPEPVATTDKKVMKDRMVTWGKKLLEQGIYTEFATHDEAVIQRFIDEVIIPGEYGADHFESQMLLGVPRTQIQQKLRQGAYREKLGPIKVRLYLPFAENKADAVTYCKRRLVENPSIVFYGLGNLAMKIFGKK